MIPIPCHWLTQESGAEAQARFIRSIWRASALQFQRDGYRVSAVSGPRSFLNFDCLWDVRLGLCFGL
jgi:hypothetical protein